MAERYALDFTTGDYFLETPANPAAGTDFALTWAQPTLIYIKSISLILTTAVAAANRFMIFEVNDGVTVLLRWGSATAHVAATAKRYIFAPGLNDQAILATTNLITSGLPDRILLRDDYNLVTLVDGLQAADQISDVRIVTLRWNTGI